MTQFSWTLSRLLSAAIIRLPGMTRLVILSASVSAWLPGVAAAQDPVPGAVRDVRPYPGLDHAVTRAVFQYGIRGHDALSIDVDVAKDAQSAQLFFRFDPSFGPNRTLRCTRVTDGQWACEEV